MPDTLRGDSVLTEVWSGERGARLLIFQNIKRLRLLDNFKCVPLCYMNMM